MRKSILVLLAIFFFFAGIAYALGRPPQGKEPKYKLGILKMEVIPQAAKEKALMVIAPQDFQDKEFSRPKEILESAGIKVTVASSKNLATGMYGMKVKSDILIKDAKAADYDAVIFIGGDGSLVYVDDPQALSLAIEAKKSNKVIGAICVAPMILAKAGVLEGVKVTVSPYGKGAVRGAGAVYTGNKVEVAGKIVTGSGPDASEDFGQALLKLLEKH